MKLEFAVTLFGLTAFYGLILALFGAGVLSETRQRQLSYGTVGLGFLLVYPLVTVLVVWIAPSWVFGIVCACIFLLWLRLIRREGSQVVSRLALCARHAVTLAAVAVLFWMPGMLGKDTGLFTEAGGDFTIYAGLPAQTRRQASLDDLLTGNWPLSLAPGRLSVSAAESNSLQTPTHRARVGAWTVSSSCVGERATPAGTRSSTYCFRPPGALWSCDISPSWRCSGRSWY